MLPRYPAHAKSWLIGVGYMDTPVCADIVSSPVFPAAMPCGHTHVPMPITRVHTMHEI
jgi:hypothetical protein